MKENKDKTLVYILDEKGQPLTPTDRFGKVRKMLKEHKAKVVKRCPFTIQLLYTPNTHVVSETLEEKTMNPILVVSNSNAEQISFNGKEIISFDTFWSIVKNFSYDSGEIFIDVNDVDEETYNKLSKFNLNTVFFRSNDKPFIKNIKTLDYSLLRSPEIVKDFKDYPIILDKKTDLSIYGSTIIVGPSGSGKDTLVNAIKQQFDDNDIRVEVIQGNMMVIDDQYLKDSCDIIENCEKELDRRLLFMWETEKDKVKINHYTQTKDSSFEPIVIIFNDYDFFTNHADSYRVADTVKSRIEHIIRLGRPAGINVYMSTQVIPRSYDNLFKNRILLGPSSVNANDVRLFNGNVVIDGGIIECTNLNVPFGSAVVGSIDNCSNSGEMILDKFSLADVKDVHID